MPSPRRFTPPWSIGERITGDVRLLLAEHAAGRMSAGQAQAAPDCLPERQQKAAARASRFSPQPPDGRRQQKAGAKGLRHEEHAASGKRDR
jgi:hypothetical protein